MGVRPGEAPRSQPARPDPGRADFHIVDSSRQRAPFWSLATIQRLGLIGGRKPLLTTTTDHGDAPLGMARLVWPEISRQEIRCRRKDPDRR